MRNPYNPMGEPRQGGAVIGVAVGAPLSLFAVSHGILISPPSWSSVLRRPQYDAQVGRSTTVYTFGSGLLGLLASASASASSRCPRRMPFLLSGGIQPIAESMSVDGTMQGFAALGQEPVRQAAEVQVPARLSTLVHACPGGAGYSLKQRAWIWIGRDRELGVVS
jgi:hypothetical protein